VDASRVQGNSQSAERRVQSENIIYAVRKTPCAMRLPPGSGRQNRRPGRLLLSLPSPSLFFPSFFLSSAFPSSLYFPISLFICFHLFMLHSYCITFVSLLSQGNDFLLIFLSTGCCFSLAGAGKFFVGTWLRSSSVKGCRSSILVVR
jgi:hypothetical protein